MKSIIVDLQCLYGISSKSFVKDESNKEKFGLLAIVGYEVVGIGTIFLFPLIKFNSKAISFTCSAISYQLAIPESHQ